jgi:hypothetical protein
LVTVHLLGSCGVDRISPAADCQRAIRLKLGKTVARYLVCIFNYIPFRASLYNHLPSFVHPTIS